MRHFMVRPTTMCASKGAMYHSVQKCHEQLCKYACSYQRSACGLPPTVCARLARHTSHSLLGHKGTCTMCTLSHRLVSTPRSWDRNIFCRSRCHSRIRPYSLLQYREQDNFLSSHIYCFPRCRGSCIACIMPRWEAGKLSTRVLDTLRNLHRR